MKNESMTDNLPMTDRPGKAIRAPKGKTACINVPVVGKRDPRGPDNNIRVWVDAQDRLHIRIEKTSRCYKFDRLINAPGYVQLVAT